MKLLTAIVCSACWVAAPSPSDPASMPPTVAVGASVGNGGLTVTLNPYGGVVACMWPSPGFFSQLRESPASAGEHEMAPGLMWGFRAADEAVWLRGMPWKVATQQNASQFNMFESLLTLGDTGVLARENSFVCPNRDVFVSRLRIYGAKPPYQVFWRAALAPRTRMVPEIPNSDVLFGDRGGFAVFADDSTGAIYHFKPRSLGKSEWERARRLVENKASTSEWASFTDGVWIGYRSSEPPSGFACGSGEDDFAAMRDADDGQRSGVVSASAPCDSAVSWDAVPSDGHDFSVTVFVTFGRSFAETRDALDQAVKSGYGKLQEEHQRFWNDWLEKSGGNPIADAELNALRTRCLMALVNGMDRATAAIMRAPLPYAGLALDWTRDCAWMTRALDLAGYLDLAEKHTLFVRDALRSVGSPGKPTGSAPMASYANHVEGTPHLALDVDASAYALCAFWEHASCLTDEARLAYLKKVWDASDLAAGFLTSWVDDRSAEPLPSFNLVHWRDERSDTQLACALSGITSAMRIAEALGAERPVWKERLRMLTATAQYHFLDAAQKWKVDDPLRYGASGIVPPNDTRWDAPIADALEHVSKADKREAISRVCDLALVSAARADVLARVRPVAREALKTALGEAGLAEAGSLRYLDTVTAAKCIIAIETLFGSRQTPTAR